MNLQNELKKAENELALAEGKKTTAQAALEVLVREKVDSELNGKPFGQAKALAVAQAEAKAAREVAEAARIRVSEVRKLVYDAARASIEKKLGELYEAAVEDSRALFRLLREASEIQLRMIQRNVASQELADPYNDAADAEGRPRVPSRLSAYGGQITAPWDLLNIDLDKFERTEVDTARIRILAK